MSGYTSTFSQQIIFDSMTEAEVLWDKNYYQA